MPCNFFGRTRMTRLDRFEWLARLGYAARGVVYLLIGWFALAAAWGAGLPDDSRGVLRRLLVQPFGRVLLASCSRRRNRTAL